MEEVWKGIDVTDGVYEVSNLGNIRRKNAINRRVSMKRDGYLYISLLINKTRKSFSIHRLVACAFIPNPLNLPQVNHKDEDKTNNNVYNLEWCTCMYNVNYGTFQERRANKRKVSVIQLNLDGSFVKRWGSVSDAERSKKEFRTGCISACCIGRNKTHAGYRWKYENESHVPSVYRTKKSCSL